MTIAYTEVLEGDTVLRAAPGPRHEQICRRLHSLVSASIANFPGTRLLPPRSRVELTRTTSVCPDLGLIATATGKLWLAAEVVSADDHRTDTVIKKQIYEEIRLPRLWMVDPRYDNVELYYASPYGHVLKEILSGHQSLEEKLLPEFQVVVSELFKDDLGKVGG